MWGSAHTQTRVVPVGMIQLSKKHDSNGFSKLFPFAIWPFTLTLVGQLSSSEEKSSGRVCSQRIQAEV